MVETNDLKWLSLTFIGKDTDGRYCFRDPITPLRVYVGDEADYIKWAAAQKRSVPLIDAATANAALRLRKMADEIEPGFDPRAWLEARGL